MATDFTCPVCSKVFSSRSRLKSHAYKEHSLYVSAGKDPTNVGSKRPKWVCPQCEQAFSTKRELEQHMSDYSRRRYESAADVLEAVRRRQEADPYYKQLRAAEKERYEQFRREEAERARATVDFTYTDAGSVMLISIFALTGFGILVRHLKNTK